MTSYRIFKYPLLVREAHLDTFGHVNNASYLAIFEEARWEFISENAYGLKKVQETGQGPTILEVNLKFLKELKLRKMVSINTQMISYERKIGRLKQWIEDEKQVLYAEAIFTIGLFDLRERKLILPTKEWLIAVGIENR